MPTIIPRISLQTPTFQPATFQGTTYTPQLADMSLLQRSLGQIEERQRATLQQRSAITEALGKVKLNAAEDEWKANYINNIQKEIDQASQLGDYSTALTIATKLAGDAVSNNELLAKVEENENYEAYKKTLDTLYLNNKIDKNTRDYFNDKNNYKFNGNYNRAGEFIGHTLTEYDKPLQQIDLSGLFSWVGNIVAEQSGSSQGVGARSATGEKTEYYSPDVAALSHSGYGWSKKDFNTINNVWEEAIKRHPEAIAYLQQQMDVNEWVLEKTERELENQDLDRNTRIKLEAEAKRLREDLYVDGDVSRPYTPQEYLYNSSRKTLESMAYNRVNTTFNVSGGGGSRGGYGTSNTGGGFSSINLNFLTKGPSGLIGNALSKHLSGIIPSGDDISESIGKSKE